MTNELTNLVQLYIEGCENCCSVSIIDLERMQRGIQALLKRAEEAEGALDLATADMVEHDKALFQVPRDKTWWLMLARMHNAQPTTQAQGGHDQP